MREDWRFIISKTQEVYKVLIHYADTGELYSIWASGKASVRYTLGIIVAAPEILARQGYHLLAFDNLSTARLFEKHLAPEVWRAEATGVIRFEKLPPFCKVDPLARGKLVPLLSEWPPNTVMCETIKLVELVDTS